MDKSELKEFLDTKVIEYNTLHFIDTDPVQIPHLYQEKEDIEIAGFLAATIAWGKREMIIKNSHKMMSFLGNSPYDFVMNHKPSDIESLDHFVHRTFNLQDFKYFIMALKYVYSHHNGLEGIFTKYQTKNSMQPAIHEFKKLFFEIPHAPRTTKHVSDPRKGSAAKRINMYLRWMVRRDTYGVDFGLWKNISPSLLSCPLDVHSGNVARKLGILQRKQNDGKALLELDTSLRIMDPKDPVKYDFALFGLGVFEGF
jgi:uncharacterized protein (TIGR02757 family)